MLLRLEAIEEIGRFASLKQKAPHFARLTLVFARNGYGKSTLCAVLRSATDGDPNHITARRRLGAKSDSRVESKWAKGPDAIFAKGKWNACPGKILVFDQEFIHRNLHVGDDVTRDNKRALLPVVMGAQGVTLSQKIVDLDREQRALDQTIKDQTAIIRAKLPVIGAQDISTFSAKEVPTDIDAKIDKAAKAVELATHAAIVKQKANPKKVAVATADYYREIAERTIADVSEDAAEQVRHHAEKHNLAPPHGERWLKYGLDHTNDHCPYCDQSLTDVTLIDAFTAYFSEAFGALVKDRDDAIEALKNVKTEFAALADANTVDFDFWKGVCTLPLLPSLSSDARIKVIAGLDLLLVALESKVKAPLAKISFDKDAMAIAAALSLIDGYNSAVESCIIAIEAAKAEVANADLAVATESLRKWEALKAKQNEPIKSAVIAYKAAEKRRAEIVKEKEQAQSDLKNFASKAIGTRQAEINDLLSNFGANFKIVDAKANFVGREPNTDYAIAVGANKIKVGEHSNTEPSFKTVLSAGDKTTLALAFFISQVKADPQLADAVVVFDDPFNSQDIYRQFETTSQIRAVAEVATQTIVLSHDPRFLDMIEKNADSAAVGTFQMLCADTGEGAISAWSASDELKDLYVKRAQEIQEYAGRGKLLKNITAIELVQGMRPFLEDYLRARYPGRFADQDMLFGMVENIKQAGNGDPMFPSVADLFSLNEYTRPEHHGGGKQPDPTELRAQCKKIVKIIGAY